MSYIIESALNAIFGNSYYTLSRYFMLLTIPPFSNRQACRRQFKSARAAAFRQAQTLP
jgi:hypothetical protein